DDDKGEKQKAKEGDDDDGEAEDDFEAMAVKLGGAISAKKISTGAMETLLAAIQEANTIPDEETADEPEPEAAGAEAMSSKKDAAKMVTMQAQIAALTEDKVERDAATIRKGDVDEAYARLKDRPLGANLRSKFDDYHTRFGAEAFKVHVDTLAATVGAIPSSGDDLGVDFRAAGGDSET
ncbi:unnamed protein product, partial [marine sediment metagenome]